MDLTFWEILLRVGLAVVAGGLIGFERELHVQPAGLRTHLLVAMGACAFTLAGVSLAGSDPARVAAQVAAGVGFLGAGVILRDKFHVKGLTTAASLWVVAALGVAAGVGAYRVGFVVTVVTLVALVLLRPFEGSLTRGRRLQDLAIDLAPATDVAQARTAIEAVVGPFAVDAVLASTAPYAASDGGTAGAGVQLVGEVRLAAGTDLVATAARLRALPGVTAVDLTQ